MTKAFEPEVVIAGGGLIGLATAFELHARGWRVMVLESGAVLQQASVAAAGMLAAADPYNPPELRSMAAWSAGLWPEFLEQVNRLSGREVRFQTETTRQRLADGSDVVLEERSVDPREVADTLRIAVRKAGVPVMEHTAWNLIRADDALAVQLEDRVLRPQYVVHATGAWFAALPGVRPKKGQMLRVMLPEQLTEVWRSERVYVVPRLHGPQRGTALVGATVEDAGFDVTTSAADLAGLRALAGELVPMVADAARAPQVEAWAGLRPAAQDGLPLLGFLRDEREFVACGHFRNGVLLAPATAMIVADALEGKPPRMELGLFRPDRFDAASHANTDIRPVTDDMGMTRV